MTASLFNLSGRGSILPTQRKLRRMKANLLLRSHYWFRICIFCLILVGIHLFRRSLYHPHSYFFLSPQNELQNVLHLPISETLKTNALHVCIKKPIRKLISFDPFTLSIKQHGVSENSFENRFQADLWDTLVNERFYPAWSDMKWNIPQYARSLASDLSILQWLAETISRVADKNKMELLPYRDANSLVDIQYVHHRLDRYRGIQYVVSFSTKKPASTSILSGKINTYTMHLEKPLDSRQGDLASCQVSIRQHVLTETVYIILPYMGREERLRLFMKNFLALYERDENIVLIVSILRTDETGANTFGRLKEEIFGSTISNVADAVQLHVNNGDSDGGFNRGVALRDAARLVKDGNSVLFQCDVDMIILPDFVNRCRRNSIQNSQVYYPTFYSLYPYGNLKPAITERNGFWRKTSFGMACMRKSDFEQVNAFGDSEIRFRGWGSEDVYQFELIRNSSKLIAHRAVDPGLMHRWHSKACDPKSNAYHDCMKTNFVTMGHPLRIGKALLDSVTDVDVFFKRLENA